VDRNIHLLIGFESDGFPMRKKNKRRNSLSSSSFFDVGKQMVAR